jgi:hypothetical protein
VRARIALAALFTLILSILATPAEAYDWVIVGKVIMVETDYAPAQVVFEVDTAAGTCSSGTFLGYAAQGSTAADKATNISAVIATLLTAMASGKRVQIYGNNTNCAVVNIWMIP